MTLAVEAVVIAAGLFFGRLLARAFRGPRRRGLSGPGGAPRTSAGDPFAAFLCKLGDVVVRRFEGDEAWLASALVFAEEEPVAALFLAPDAERERALLVHAAPDKSLIWLNPIGTERMGALGDPPLSVEDGGDEFHRTRRLPVRIERFGADAPSVGDQAVVAEYAAAGFERLFLLIAAGDVRAWRGVMLAEGEYDLLPGGKATLFSGC